MSASKHTQKGKRKKKKVINKFIDLPNPIKYVKLSTSNTLYV